MSGLQHLLTIHKGPARALLGDLAPTERLSHGNAYMSAANGFGKVSVLALHSTRVD